MKQMKQESRSIYDFKPGDIVTRVEPAVCASGSAFGFMGGVIEDGNYIGEKLVFLGIVNGCAHFEPTDSITKTLEGGKPISLKIYKFENGWAHYINPMTLVDSKPISKYNSLSDEALFDRRDEAILKEDYEEASRVQHEIDKREL